MARTKKKTRAQLDAEKVAARARDLEAVNIHADAATLPVHADIEITRAGAKREAQKVDNDTARRPDAFTALRAGLAQGCYDAARRLEHDLLVRHGLSDRGRSMERVDCTAGLTTDAIISAAQRVEKVQDRMAPRDFWLLNELINPAGREWLNWREAVAYITGENHSEGQAAAVRAACINLRDAYAAMERKAA